MGYGVLWRDFERFGVLDPLRIYKRSDILKNITAAVIRNVPIRNPH